VNSYLLVAASLREKKRKYRSGDSAAQGSRAYDDAGKSQLDPPRTVSRLLKKYGFR
jgi:hypothetical protein